MRRGLVKVAEGAKGVAPRIAASRPFHTTWTSLQQVETKIQLPVEPVIGPHQIYHQPLPESGWTPESRRVGVIALKCGMIADWDKWGKRHALTVLKMEDVSVTQVKDKETHGFSALQVGAGYRKAKNVNMPTMGHLNKAGVGPKAVLGEFRVTEDAMLDVGTRLYSQHFVPGQFVDVTGKSHGKGFQGVMKRWGFGGQPASHGVSKAHRSHGSTGACQDPGRVWKGKKMAGRMGHHTVTMECLQVYKIDVKRDLVYIKGAVPGKAGSYIRISDSKKKLHKTPPPFPTYTPDQDYLERLDRWARGEYLEPVEAFELEQQGRLPTNYEPEPPYEVIMDPDEFDPFGMHAHDEPEP